MKKIVASTISLLIAFVGLTGGVIWAMRTDWGIESVILIICSALEIIGFSILKRTSTEAGSVVQGVQQSSINQQTTVNVRVGNNSPEEQDPTAKTVPDRNLIIDSMKTQIVPFFKAVDNVPNKVTQLMGI